jgi:hypothetical protein
LTNLYAQQQIATMPWPITKYAMETCDNIWNEEMSWSDVPYRCNSKTKIRMVLVNKRHFSDTHSFTNDV